MDDLSINRTRREIDYTFSRARPFTQYEKKEIGVKGLARETRLHPPWKKELKWYGIAYGGKRNKNKRGP